MVLQSVGGLIFFCSVAWLISEDRRGVSLRFVLTGILFQLFTGVILLRFPFVRDLFKALNTFLMVIGDATTAGTSLVFGYLGGGALPFREPFSGASYILAFQGLPLVLVMSALSALLFYWGIIQKVVQGFSSLLRRTFGIGGAEGVGVSANIFVGMVEAPLLIRPYLGKMTRSEIFTVMTCGMSTIAGTVMVLYASILMGTIEGILGHILTASIISAPAAITIAKIMVPESGEKTSGDLAGGELYRGPMDAVTKGTTQGVALLLNIVAMIIVLVAMVYLVNQCLGILPVVSGEALSLQRCLGWLMAPFCWLMGIPWAEAVTAGSLMGTKTVLNEFIAYLDLSRLPEGALSERSRIIVMYAMCGFANPGSLGIMIGGLGGMAPERRDEIVSLGFRSVVGGTLATCMTGAVAGLCI